MRRVRYRDMVHYLGMLLKELKLVVRSLCSRGSSAGWIFRGKRGRRLGGTNLFNLR